MKIGVPKEIKAQEYRAGTVPFVVEELTRKGHEVFVESGLGAGINLEDSDYETAGATVLQTAKEVFDIADMVIKVKEPQPSEYKLMKEGQILFTYLHLAADKPQAEALMEQGVTAIAYETVTSSYGTLPLLTPMSEIAGRLSIQAGATGLEKSKGGSGILLGGVAGVNPAKVVIIGGGVVGQNALRMAVGLGARVFVLDKSIKTLRELDARYRSQIQTIYSTSNTIAEEIADADLVIGAVLVPGASAPKLVKREHLSSMLPGSVLVDVAIDQGGCFETSKPTTYEDPTYVVDGVVHYCVANMPGAVPRTSTFALNNATYEYVVQIADQGLDALRNNPHILNGLNTYQGKITYKAVADELSLDYLDPQTVFGS